MLALSKRCSIRYLRINRPSGTGFLNTSRPNSDVMEKAAVAEYGPGISVKIRGLTRHGRFRTLP